MPPNFTNRTIWTGDNLDVMRGMNSDCVDLIYLDPPFNSGKEWSAPIGSEAAGAAFKDTWSLSDVNLVEHGAIKEKNAALHAVIGAAGLAHGKPMQSYLIYMGIRMLEMKRVLKPAGSVYLHCDDTAGAWLKAMMDAVLGAGSMRAQIVWRRYGSHNDASGYGRVHDTLLFYAKDGAGVWNGSRRELDPDYVAKTYRHDDGDGRGLYRTAPLHTGGLTGGGYGYEFRGHTRVWRYPETRMHELDADRRIRQARGGAGVPERKVYLSESTGRPVPNLWDDIPALAGNHAERIGYPTQKPLALLERIVAASSNEGDMVLDPFCGCATACVAAEKLDRQWAGIDVSPLAYSLVQQRLAREVSVGSAETPLLTGWNVTHREDVPQRTDLGVIPPYNSPENRERLYGRQGGDCNGCEVHFLPRNLTVDHIVPQSRGGSHHIDNLQLLCGACNSKKGAGTQAELIVNLQAEGVRP